MSLTDGKYLLKSKKFPRKESYKKELELVM